MKYHFIGIKGSGMSSLAQIMFDLGNEVQGSDKEDHFFTQDALEERGIKLLPYNKLNINNAMIVIVGASIKPENEELMRAKELNVTCYSYYEFLGGLTKQYQTYAICGCHGKTTISSLLAHVYDDLIGVNYLIGDGTGKANKNNTKLIIEACEYCRHFLYYYPKTTIITNIELDHVDYYEDLEDIKSAYISFANQTEDRLIMCGDDENIRDIKEALTSSNIYYYGVNTHNDFMARNVINDERGTTFDFYFREQFIKRITTSFFGHHMLLNTLAVLATSFLDGLSMINVEESIATYEGAKRRFVQTRVGDCVIIDDYAHHPTEIRAIIDATRQKYPDKEIISIFNPHTFSRTKALYKDIAFSLDASDMSYILPIYKARETQEDFPGITSSLIVDSLKRGDYLTSDDLSPLLKHKKAVFIFMSPDDLKMMIDKLVILLEQK